MNIDGPIRRSRAHIDVCVMLCQVGENIRGSRLAKKASKIGSPFIPVCPQESYELPCPCERSDDGGLKETTYPRPLGVKLCLKIVFRLLRCRESRFDGLSAQSKGKSRYILWGRSSHAPSINDKDLVTLFKKICGPTTISIGFIEPLLSTTMIRNCNSRGMDNSQDSQPLSPHRHVETREDMVA